MDNKVSMSLGIDLGAKNTGLFLVTSKVTNDFEDPKLEAQAFTLVMPKSDKFCYSMTKRTTQRHSRRSNRRFKLARRLLKLIIDFKIQTYQQHHQKFFTPNEISKAYNALFGLLKRRGYTRLESETDLSLLNSLNTEVFSCFPEIKQFFNDNSSIKEQWQNLIQDQAKTTKLSIILKKIQNKDFENYFLKEFADLKSEKKKYSKAFSLLKEDLEKIVNSEILGNRNRKDYLGIIKEEMLIDSRLSPIYEVFNNEQEKLFNLIGNISNLQLRCLRWYFNCPEMITGDILKENELKKCLIKALKYLRPNEEQRADFKEVIQQLEDSSNILDTLCNLDPFRTIPPYEAQDNRHPVVDQTLLLNPHVLNQLYGDKWIKWAELFVAREPYLIDKLSEIVNCTGIDRKSRSFTNQNYKLPNEHYIASYVIQRVLDKVKKADRYSLKKISSKTNITDEELKALTNTLKNKEDAIEFLQLAKNYYQEVKDAYKGLWEETENHLLERADIHPKKKQKDLYFLVGDILNVLPTKAKYFIEEIWNTKVIGEKYQIKTACQEIEKLRKARGNLFNQEYQKNKLLLAKNEIQDLELKKIIEKVDKTCNSIKEKLALNEDQFKRIANPFTLTQLYNLIEQNINGFSKNTRAIQKENKWRMTACNNNAICCRLPADSVRPFDGVLVKNLDKQAFEISKILAEQIKNTVNYKNSTINLALLIEQNSFSFTNDLNNEIKLNLKDRDLDDPTANLYKSKIERIKEASHHICAYTGKDALTDVNAEIDHIIPRSKTKKNYGTIFNSEANLIYVSRKGNQNKGKELYTLDNLNDKYLKSIFNTSDTSKIKDIITETVLNLDATHKLPFFETQNELEQNCVRHALFLTNDSEAKKLVISTLLQQNKAIVNGTQSWFVRQIIKKLKIELKNWNIDTKNKIVFKTWKINSQDSIAFRQAIADQYPIFTKVKPQPVLSHSIDAMSVFAVATQDNEMVSFTNTNPLFCDYSHCHDIIKLFPQQAKIINVNPKEKDTLSKKTVIEQNLLKDSIFKENYLSLIQCKDKLYVGFGLNNKNDNNTEHSLEVTSNNGSVLSMLNLIADYLDKPVDLTKPLITYNIVKTKTYELFSEIAKNQNPTEKKLRIAQILNSLKFITQKKEISSLVIDKQSGKTTVNLNNLDNEKKKFSKNFSLKDPQFSFNGKLVTNNFNEFKQLLLNKDIVKILKSKDNKTRKAKFNSVLKALRKRGSMLKHSSYKRAYSISVIPSTTGLIRIKRKNMDNQDVYQMYQTSSSTQAYMRKDDNSVNWLAPIIYPNLNSKNLTPNNLDLFEGKQVNIREWKSLDITEISQEIKIAMCINSKDRCMLKLTIPFELFQQIIKKCNKENYQNILNVPPSIKLKKTDQYAKCFKCICKDPQKIFGKPYSELSIEDLGPKVTYRYIVENTSKEMKAKFDKACLEE